MTRPLPGTRADYSIFAPLTTRWMDNDVMGHVNNAVFYSFFDTAITRHLVAHGILGRPGADHVLMVAESACRYHQEVAFPDSLATGLRLARLGTSSIRHDVAVFRDGAETAAAEGHFVHVCVAAATRRPAPMPDAWRRLLEPFLMERR